MSITDDLFSWIKQTIGTGSAYVEKKKEIYSNVGFEDGRGYSNVSFEGSVDDLVDLHLGLRESLPFTSFSYISQRFGIDAPKPEIEAAAGTMHVEARGRECSLRLQGGVPTEELSIDAMLFSPGVPDLPDEQRRFRLVAGPLDLIVGINATTANMTLQFDERRPLESSPRFSRLPRGKSRAESVFNCVLTGRKYRSGFLK